MEQSAIQFLQEASISVISIAALVYLSHRFLLQQDKRATAHDDAMRERSTNHEIAMLERENQIRIVESDFRNTVMPALTQNTQTMSETARVMERVITNLDSKQTP